MRLVGYSRVSRVAGRAGESFISPEVQRSSVEAYSKANGHEIVAWFEDLDQTGGRLDRPGLREALALVERGEAEGIVAAKLDRLTRSVADLGKLLDQAKAGGWNLVAVDVGLDLRSPNGEFVAGILGQVAQWERARRREDWNVAQGRAVARGVHIASRVPTGYRRRPDKRLEPHPKTAKVIRELFQRRAAGQGWRALADFFNESGVVSPYGNHSWTTGAIQKIIRNRVYLGEARSGRHVNADAHDPIVTRADWEAAQSARIGASPRSGDGLLLAGLVRCAGCRYLMKADHMRDRDGSQLGLYRCRGRHAAGGCPGGASVLARVIDPFIEQQFLDALAGDGPIGVPSASSTRSRKRRSRSNAPSRSWTRTATTRGSPNCSTAPSFIEVSRHGRARSTRPVTISPTLRDARDSSPYRERRAISSRHGPS